MAREEEDGLRTLRGNLRRGRSRVDGGIDPGAFRPLAPPKSQRCSGMSHLDRPAVREFETPSSHSAPTMVPIVETSVPCVELGEELQFREGKTHGAALV